VHGSSLQDPDWSAPPSPRPRLPAFPLPPIPHHLSPITAFPHPPSPSSPSPPIPNGVDSPFGEAYTRPIPAMGGVRVKRYRGLLLVCLCSIICLGAIASSPAGNGVPSEPAGNGVPDPPETDGLFTDVPRDHWAYQDLEYLLARGILTALPGGTYNGTAPLTRYDAAAMIARAVRYTQNNPEAVTADDLNVIKDLIFDLSDDVSALQSQSGSSQGADLTRLESRISRNEQEIARLASSDEDPGTLARRVQNVFFVSLTALLLSIAGIALAVAGL
jgi:hypothetical protein